MATESYSFFNSEGVDRRLYDAFDFAKYHADFYDSGVVHRTNDALKVTVKEGMTLRVANGSAFISGYRYELEGGDMTLSVALASGSNRVDRVVLRLDLGARTISLAVKQGTTSPPGLTRTGTVWELSLARVTARAGVSVIAAGDVADERADNSVCGWARSSADPAFVPSDALPEVLWRYTFFPDTLTAQEKATVQGNAQMMAMFRASKAMSDEKKATAAEALAGSDNAKWMTPNAFKGALDSFWSARSVVTGTYTGTGQSTSQTINLGFTPKAVLAMVYAGMTTFPACVLAINGAPAYWYTGAECRLLLQISGTSFIVSDMFNNAPAPYSPYRYIVLR